MLDLRVALVIFNAKCHDKEKNFEKMHPWIRRAKDCGADLVCFPELNISGYGIHEEMSREGEPLAGPLSMALEETAASEGVTLLAGLVETDTFGRRFASHLVISPGSRIKAYRKLHIPPPEKGLFYPGNEIPLFNHRSVSFGIQLCYDAHFPELASKMTSQGAEVIFFPHASPRGTPEKKLSSWCKHLVARAYDNSLFVLACNQTGDNGRGLEFPGLAVAIGPDGELLGKNIEGKEGLLVVDLKKEDLKKVRGHRMRYFFPHRRDDLY